MCQPCLQIPPALRTYDDDRIERGAYVVVALQTEVLGIEIHLLTCACGTFTPFFTTKGFPGSLSHLFNFPVRTYVVCSNCHIGK